MARTSKRCFPAFNPENDAEPPATNWLQGPPSMRCENNNRSAVVSFHLSMPENTMRAWPSGGASLWLSPATRKVRGGSLSASSWYSPMPSAVPAQILPRWSSINV